MVGSSVGRVRPDGAKLSSRLTAGLQNCSVKSVSCSFCVHPASKSRQNPSRGKEYKELESGSGQHDQENLGSTQRGSHWHPVLAEAGWRAGVALGLGACMPLSLSLGGVLAVSSGCKDGWGAGGLHLGLDAHSGCL